MDSIWVSEAYDPGSIPGKATKAPQTRSFFLLELYLLHLLQKF